MKKSPIITLIPGIISAGLSLIKDKKQKDAPFEISSKRVLNVVGTGAIITFALNDMANGITSQNLIMLTLGIVYSIAMTFLTASSETE